jgi:UDP-N-acetyl-D-mannosaminouronate:lipid I N-acetyl-D-mannosaminouronosyltransferase
MSVIADNVPERGSREENLLSIQHSEGSMSTRSDSFIKVGGVPVSPFDSLADCARRILSDACNGTGGFAIAINAEKVITCGLDRKLEATIDRATLRYPDGAGVVVAMRLKGARSKRVAGADLWLEVLRQARGRYLGIALIGARPEILTATRQRIEKEFPDVHVLVARNGYDGLRDTDALTRELAVAKPHLVFVALGSPGQELLIEKLRAAHPTGFYMGLGGSFDIYSGAKKRAPQWMQRCGLEWLYRFLAEPSRAPRETKRLRFLALLLLGRL